MQQMRRGNIGDVANNVLLNVHDNIINSFQIVHNEMCIPFISANYQKDHHM